MYKCIKEYKAPSFPNDYHIKVGETVDLIGYFHNSPTIQLDPLIHKPDYGHLTSVLCIVVVGFNDHFEKDDSL